MSRSLALSLLVAATASAEGRRSVVLCDEPTRDEVEAVAELDAWLRSAQLLLDQCTAENLPSRRLQFLERRQGVVLRLDSDGAGGEREVPWLDKLDAPLARLRAGGALSKVSVLIEALLAEEALATPAPSPPKAHSPPRPPAPPPPPEAPPEPPPTPLPAAAPPAPVATIQAPPPASPTPWSVEALAGARVRTPDISAFEYAARARWGIVELGASFTPRTVWSLGGVPVALVSGGADIGGYRDFLHGGPLAGGLQASVTGDWVSLRRLDVPNAAVAQYLEIGFAAGAHGSYRFGPFGLELRLEYLLNASARQIEISGGPHQTLNLMGIRASLGLFWTS